MTIHAKIKIHMAGAKVVKVVDKETAAKWKRHTHVIEFIRGKAKVYIHTDLLLLHQSQRMPYLIDQYEKKNPVIMDIVKAAKRVLGEEVEEEKEDWLSRALRTGKID